MKEVGGVVLFVLLVVGVVLLITGPADRARAERIRAEYRREVDRCRELGGETITERTQHGPKLQSCYFAPRPR